MMKYDMIFVGAGPSTIWSLLYLAKQNYKGKVLVLEQGHNVEDRPRTDIQRGYAGSGCFSDFKMSFEPTVGGKMASRLTEEEFENYGNLVLDLMNDFLDEKREWVKGVEYVCPSDIKFVTSRICHIGTNNGFEWAKRTEKYLSELYEFKFNTEVVDITPSDDIFFVKDNNGEVYQTDYLIVGTGPNDKLMSKVDSKIKLEKYYDSVQMGIRVESSNDDGRWTDILAHNYDFKFRKTYENGNVRTFCCNSYDAHVAKETNGGLFDSYNGHANRGVENPNNKVNFGIICEYNKGFDKDLQIKICQAINQNFQNNPYDMHDSKFVISRSYPAEIANMLNDFIDELNHIVKIDDAKFYIPEIKLINERVKSNKYGEVYPKLYEIGDLIISRGITQSAMSGILAIEDILNKMK